MAESTASTAPPDAYASATQVGPTAVVTEKKKRGNQGDFSPARLQWLKKWLPVIQQYHDGAGGEKPKRETRDSPNHPYNRAFAEYWGIFPLSIALKLDPPEQLPEQLPETPETMKKKGDIEKKIVAWWSRARTKQSGNDPFQDFFKGLKPSGAPPRRLADCQYYMQLPEFASKIAKALEDAGHANKPPRELIGPRYKVAAELLDREPATVKTRVKEECDEEYRQALEEFTTQKTSRDSRTAEEQELARERLVTVAQRFLDELQRFTDCELTLLVAHVNTQGSKPDVRVSSVHAGFASEDIPEYRKFPKAAPTDLKQVLKHFSNFVGNAYLTQTGGALTSNGATSGLMTVLETNAEDEVGGAAPAQSSTSSPGTALPPAASAVSTISDPASPAASGNASAPAAGDVATTSKPATPIASADASSRAAGANSINSGQAQSPASDAARLAASDSDTDMPLALIDTSSGPPSSKSLFAKCRSVPGPELAEYVLGLGHRDQAEKIRELETMSEYELQRENNIARNRKTMIALGLLDPNGKMAVATWGKSSSSHPGPRKAKRSRPSAKKSDTETSEDEEDGNADGNGDKDAGKSAPKTRGRKKRAVGVQKPAPETRARKKRGGDVAPAPAANSHSASTSHWTTEWKDYLSLEPACGEWTRLVSMWEQRERILGNENRKTLAGKARPKQVSHWVSRGRPLPHTPAISDPVAFGSVFGTWWLELNPKWRVGSNVLKELVEGENADWEGTLLDEVAGVNGFFNVVVCLKWWFDAAKGKPEAKWLEYVVDVRRVLEALYRRVLPDSTQMVPNENEDVAAGNEDLAAAAKHVNADVEMADSEVPPRDDVVTHKSDV
uniref:Uncharacterized protein n=1 Tax=Mycena chlorophos TaxID=658473 RepID=A0ABQ0KVI0_MYCCL|nr:predicted protein [Mycena chlorophos]